MTSVAFQKIFLPASTSARIMLNSLLITVFLGSDRANANAFIALTCEFSNLTEITLQSEYSFFILNLEYATYYVAFNVLSYVVEIAMVQRCYVSYVGFLRNR